MSAGDLTPGRRVASLDDMQGPGDYWLNPARDPNGDQSLWFYLPICNEDRSALASTTLDDGTVIEHKPWEGRHRIASPSWSITEQPDGTITASPSIACGRPVYWHGYLEHGAWREV